MTQPEDRILWQPSPERVASSVLAEFASRHGPYAGQPSFDYAGLHRWSIEQPETFWKSIWEFGGVLGEPGDTVYEPGADMRTTRFFPDATLNFAENLLRRSDSGEAIVALGEDGRCRRVTWQELNIEAGAFCAWLERGRPGSGRPGGRRVTKHRRDGQHDAGHHRAGRSLLVGITGLRRAGPAGPLCAGRAESHDRLRRISVQRQDRGHSRADQRCPEAAADRGAGRDRSVHGSRRTRRYAGLARAARRTRAAVPPSSAPCHSITRCTSCLPAARPVHPSASYIAPVGASFSI